MIVADTCAIIWDALQPENLSKKAKDAFNDANDSEGIYFCEVSLWEIAILIKKKRLVPGVPYQEFMDLVLASNDYQLVGLNPEIAELSVHLPDSIGGDPADRIIAATSITYSAPLITADKQLRKYQRLQTIW